MQESNVNGQLIAVEQQNITGTTVLVNVALDGTQANNDSYSYGASISADGRYVVFSSDASNLVQGDTNGSEDIFIRNLLTGMIEMVSVASDGTPGNGYSEDPSISADGRYVVFSSDANNLVPGDTNYYDIFVRDRLTGITEPFIKSGGQPLILHSAGSSTEKIIFLTGRTEEAQNVPL